MMKKIYRFYIVALAITGILSYSPLANIKVYLYLTKYFPLFGVLPFSYFFIKRRGAMVRKTPVLMFGVSLLFYIGTTIKDYDISYAQNIKNIFWLGLVYFIIYTWDMYESSEWEKEYKKVFLSIWKSYTIIFLIENVLNFFILINGVVLYREGVVTGWHPSAGRFYPISSAYGAIEYCVVNVFVLFMSFYMIKHTVRLMAWKCLSFINALFFLFTLMGQASRTSYLLAVFLFSGVWILKRMNLISPRDLIITGAGVIMITGLSTGVFVFGQWLTPRIVKADESVEKIVYKYYVNLIRVENFDCPWIEKKSSDTSTESVYGIAERELEKAKRIAESPYSKRVFVSENNYEGSRLSGTKNMLKIAGHSLLLGVGVGNDDYYRERYLDENAFVGGYSWGVVLMRKGLMGFLIDIISFLYIFFRTLRHIRREKIDKSKQIRTIYLLVAAAAGFIFNPIFFAISGSTIIFWLTFAWLGRNELEERTVSGKMIRWVY